MNRYPLQLSVFFIFLIFITATGCAGMPREVSDVDSWETADLPVFSVREPPGSYYYYLVAHDMVRRQHIPQAAEFLQKAITQDPGSIILKHELSLIYLQLNRNDEALALSEDILKDHPDNIEAIIIAASIRQAKGEVEPASELYEKVIEAAPDRKNIYLVLGRLYLQESLFDKAAHVFNRLIDRHEDEYIGHYYLGASFSGLGDVDQAMASFKRSIEIEPDFMESRHELANIYLEMGETRKAMDMYEKIIEKEPSDVSTMIALGLLYLKNDRDPDANVIFERLGTLAGLHRGVIDIVVQNLILQERYEDAFFVISGMLKSLPSDQDLHYLAGISGYLAGKHDNVLFHLGQVGAKSRFHADAVVRTATIHSEKNQPEEGIRVLAAAFDNLDHFTEPDKLRIIRFLGAFYLEVKKHQEAMTVLRHGIRIDPDNIDLHYDLGVAYDKSGDSERTIAQMRAIIDKDPDHADALNYLGYTYAAAGINLNEAESLIRRALEIKPDSGYILDSMGWVYFQKGDIERAVLYLEKAVEKRPEDPVILEHLGDAYLKLSRKEEALTLYQRAVLAGGAGNGMDNGNDEILQIKKKIDTLKNK